MATSPGTSPWAASLAPNIAPTTGGHGAAIAFCPGHNAAFMLPTHTHPMPPVLIPCPSADWLVPTGEVVERLDELDGSNVLRRCVECGRDHEWTPADAVLAGNLVML